MPGVAADSSQPWYRSLNRSQWNTLIASNLGWLFDGYETYALVISIGVALRQLLDPSQYAQIPTYAGVVIATTLLGWGIGGLIGGVIADYIGRKRTMLFAILAYSIMTGLSAFAWDWWSFAIMRFLVGVCHRLRMGDRRLDRLRALARQEPRQGRRPDAMRLRHRLLPRLGGVVADQSGRPERLARDVPPRRRAGAADALDPPLDPGSERWEHVNEQRNAATARMRSGADAQRRATRR